MSNGKCNKNVSLLKKEVQNGLSSSWSPSSFSSSLCSYESWWLSYLMDCLCPCSKKNEKYGLEPNQPAFINFPCGRCEACLRRKQSTWFTRLKFEQKNSYYCCFVTLTYDESHLPPNGDVRKEDIQSYHKRFRALLGPRRSKLFKYYLTSEYGPENLRPHYHAIYFGASVSDLSLIEKAWQNGFVMVEEVTDGRLRYVTGYIIEKLFVPDGHAPLFNLISKGLGSCYIEQYRSWHLGDSIIQRSFVPYYGTKLPLPRYFKEKLYSPTERKAYAMKLQEDADEHFRESIGEVGLQEYLRRVRSGTREYVERVRKTHKKKKL